MAPLLASSTSDRYSSTVATLCPPSAASCAPERQGSCVYSRIYHHVSKSRPLTRLLYPFSTNEQPVLSVLHQ